MAMVCAALVTLTASTISAAPAASAATTVVASIGSHGSTVVIIQRAVKASPDGIYGPLTAAAVRVWQRAHLLPVTGVVDSITWAKLKPAQARCLRHDDLPDAGPGRHLRARGTLCGRHLAAQAGQHRLCPGAAQRRLDACGRPGLAHRVGGRGVIPGGTVVQEQA